MGEDGTPRPGPATGEPAVDPPATSSHSFRDRPHRTMKDQAREMSRVYRKEFTRNWVLFKESKIGVVGLGIIIFFVMMAIFAPIIPIASERHPTEWQGPVGDLNEVENIWFSPAGKEYISDADPSGQWGHGLTRSSVLLGYGSSGSRAELIVQGTDKGLFGIAPGRPCNPGGQLPKNPCLPGDSVRKPFRIDDIGQVVGQPLVNTHNQKLQNLDKSQMWKNRIYATTADGSLYSFRLEYDRADPNFAPLAIRPAGPLGTHAIFNTSGTVSVGPAFDFLGECEQATITADCMNTVYVVSDTKLFRVRETLKPEPQDVYTSSWKELWNLSLGNFTVRSQPLFAPVEQDFGSTTKVVSMLVAVGDDGRLHAYRNNDTNASSMVGESAWVWPDPAKPDLCYSGKDGPLNPLASPRARPRGLTGEWKTPATSNFYASSEHGDVFVIDNNGKCVRFYRTFTDVKLWTPQVTESEEVLHVGAEDGWVYEFSAEGAGAGGGANSTAGDLVWKFRTGGPVRSAPFSSSLFYLASRIFVPSEDGTLYLLKAERARGAASIHLRIEMGEGSSMNQAVLLDDASGNDLVLISTTDGKMGLYTDIGDYLAPLAPGCYGSGICYPFGTDFLGRDVFSQLVWGSQLALMIGFLAAFFSIAIGLIVGLVAGYFGGKTDSVLMRFTDVVLVLPGLPFLIVLASVLGTNIFNLVLVIALIGWPGTARIIRAEVLSLKERPYVDAARITGASHARIMFKHISPNVFPLVFLFLTFAVSGAIIAEASLSFIGLGDTNRMSWGIMLYYAQYTGNALTAWWWLLPPGIAITLISLGFFLVGRAFEQIINPRLRKR